MSARPGGKTGELLALLEAGWEVTAPRQERPYFVATSPSGEVHTFSSGCGPRLKRLGLAHVERGTGRLRLGRETRRAG